MVLYSHFYFYEPEFKINVTLLFASVSSELPFCKTALLKKPLISPTLFGVLKNGEKDVVLLSLGNRKMHKSQFSRQGGLCILFFKTFG